MEMVCHWGAAVSLGDRICRVQAGLLGHSPVVGGGAGVGAGRAQVGPEAAGGCCSLRHAGLCGAASCWGWQGSEPPPLHTVGLSLRYGAAGHPFTGPVCRWQSRDVSQEKPRRRFRRSTLGSGHACPAFSGTVVQERGRGPGRDSGLPPNPSTPWGHLEQLDPLNRLLPSSSRHRIHPIKWSLRFWHTVGLPKPAVAVS